MYSRSRSRPITRFELLQNFVQTIDNIIPGIEDMAEVSRQTPIFSASSTRVENGTQPESYGQLHFPLPAMVSKKDSCMQVAWVKNTDLAPLAIKRIPVSAPCF